MRNILLSLLLIATMPALCQKVSSEKSFNIKITNDVVSESYIGNGVQWDAYPEAEQWGSKVSDADWDKLYQRLDFMRPQFVRCLINSPFRYYDVKTGSYDKTRNIDALSKLLGYCQRNNVTVLFGEFNPPTPEMYLDTAWVNMAVDYLNYLVTDLGFTCIKYYNFFNEPDGNWSTIDGDFEKWVGMVRKFSERMNAYPGLADKVSFGGPDAVMDYRNSKSKYDTKGWVAQTRIEIDSLVGVYDVHAYPGQNYVRSGRFAEDLRILKAEVPSNKKILLGEAGYKYYSYEDDSLVKLYAQRAANHSFTKGSDANMLVYDYFYGLDMPLLSMEVMNNGFSGMAAWMLDDAMHSNGDAGNTKDIKLWGMWNILGSEVFGKPEEEELRPWFYTWSLMCRYFPAGVNILKFNGNLPKDVHLVAGVKDGKLTVAAVNVSKTSATLNIAIPQKLNNAKVYRYQENKLAIDENGFPIPLEVKAKTPQKLKVELPAQSFYLITNFK